MLLTDPVRDELNLRVISERRLMPLAVVEDLDVDALEAGGLHFSMTGITNPMHPLVLEAVEPVFRWRVIPAVPLPAHQAGHAERLELVLKDMTGVLAAPVGVMQQLQCRVFAEPGHGQRIRHPVRRHARLQRPANDYAVDQIEHDGQIQPVFIRPEVGDVRCPNLVWRRRREVSGKPVLGHREPLIRVRCVLVAPLVTGMKALVARQSLDPCLAGREAPHPLFARHAWAAVALSSA